MSTIHTSRYGAGYRSWIEGNHDWCYGFGTTWQAAIVNLLQAFESTLGLGIHVDACLAPKPEQQNCKDCGEVVEKMYFAGDSVTVCGCEPLDGMAAENAREPLFSNAESYSAALRALPLRLADQASALMPNRDFNPGRARKEQQQRQERLEQLERDQLASIENPPQQEPEHESPLSVAEQIKEWNERVAAGKFKGHQRQD